MSRSIDQEDIPEDEFELGEFIKTGETGAHKYRFYVDSFINGRVRLALTSQSVEGGLEEMIIARLTPTDAENLATLLMYAAKETRSNHDTE